MDFGIDDKICIIANYLNSNEKRGVLFKIEIHSFLFGPKLKNFQQTSVLL